MCVCVREYVCESKCACARVCETKCACAQVCVGSAAQCFPAYKAPLLHGAGRNTRMRQAWR